MLKQNDATFDTEGIKLVASNYKIEDYKRKINKDKESKFESIDFSMDNPSKNDEGMVNHIQNEAQKFYSVAANKDKTLYMRDTGLERHIKRYGKAAGRYPRDKALHNQYKGRGRGLD